MPNQYHAACTYAEVGAVMPGEGRSMTLNGETVRITANAIVAVTGEDKASAVNLYGLYDGEGIPPEADTSIQTILKGWYDKGRFIVS